MSVQLQESKNKNCFTQNIKPDQLNEVARLLYEAFVKEKKYGPVDKLGLAASRDSLLVALYEVERGVRSEIKDIPESFEKVFKSIADDARDSKCLEEAIRTAHVIAVKALSVKG